MSVSFLGPVSRATVTLDDGTVVVAQLASPEAMALTVGERVAVGIDPSPVLVVAG